MLWAKIAFGVASTLIGGIILVYTYHKTRSQYNSNGGYTYGDQRRENRRRCAICLREMRPSEQVTLPCGDSFCKECLRPLFSGTQRTCCECRAELDEQDLNSLRRTLLL